MHHHSSRRGFLKSAALAGLASGIVPLVTQAGEEQAQQPSPNEKGLVFLFQGDSITDGNRGRNADPNHIMGHGYAFAVASRIGADFPDQGYLFYNRGISGNTVPDLEKRWQADTLELKPTVLSILIGINDTAAVVNNRPGAVDVVEFENGYRRLLQQCRDANPAILFVLGIPFVYPVGKIKDNQDAWKEGTGKRAAIVRRLAAEFNAVLVDYPAVLNKAMQKAPPEYWIWDGIHPTVFAHELMAREWIKQVSGRLSFLKKYRYK